MRWGLCFAILAACGGNEPNGGNDAGPDAQPAKDAQSDARVQDVADELSPNAVTGLVVDEACEPIAGATVTIGSTTVTTDSNGQFAVDGVGASYDAFVVNYAYGLSVFASYVGLTTRTPTLQTDAQTGWSTTVKGSISPAPATSEHIALSFDGTQSGYCDPTEMGQGVLASGAWNVNYQVCYGLQAIQGTAFALTYDAVTGLLPSNLIAFGQAKMTMLVSGSNTIAAVPMTASPPQGSTSISATGDSSLTGWELGVAFNVGGHGRLDFAGSTAQATVATLATTGATIGVSATAHTTSLDGGSAWSVVSAFQGSLPPSGNVSLALPLPIASIAPSDGATAVPSSATFSWQAMPNAAYRLSVICFVNNQGVYEGSVVTGATQATLPSDQGLGIGIPSGADCHWEVVASGPSSSVDDLASGIWSPPNVLFWSEHATSGFSGSTPTWAFLEQ